MSSIHNQCINFPVPQFERCITRSSGCKLQEKKGKPHEDDEITVTHVKPGASPAKSGPSSAKTPKCKCKLAVMKCRYNIAMEI